MYYAVYNNTKSSLIASYLHKKKQQITEAEREYNKAWWSV